ncbi:MAG: ORF6N domain-containing protein [Fibrobacter sp.]|nr:ORF6N domain-containing protein [Fibrobacter sp.]
MKNIIPAAIITEKIFEIRDKRVMIDAGLALFYQVPTKALNQAVKRNLIRIPEDFMFKLNAAGKIELVTKCDQFTKLEHSTVLPHVFTECGSPQGVVLIFVIVIRFPCKLVLYTGSTRPKTSIFYSCFGLTVF